MRAGPRLYFDTLRHLRPAQIYGRAFFRLSRPTPDVRPAPPLSSPQGVWTAPARRRQSQFGPDAFRFLNEDGDLSRGWDDLARTKLWRYALHYFDDLNAAGASARAAWHRALIARWIAENPPGRGTGWEPYPTSLRIVNWIKWALGPGGPVGEAQDSLAVQTRWLARRLEWHLLGNHLFANAKALLFAGAAFAGEEAARWRRTGLAIMDRELDEQVLPDGAQFELSPMYHTLALEDVLDLINLAAAFPGAIPDRLLARLRARAASMETWLRAMLHPDGEIAFFNDAAIGVAPPPVELMAYADRLGLGHTRAPFARLTHLADSGYLRMEAGPAIVLIDVARVGPDYLPGHAHADTLSFELSLGGRRLFVNSGTSLYGESAERQRQRGTAAHNTVVIDSQDSSEVWAGFRVARRARPFGLDIHQDGVLTVSCAHDGYARLRGAPAHRRVWTMDDTGLRIDDTVEGGAHAAEARFHVHPEARVALDDGGLSADIALPGGMSVRVTVLTGAARVEETRWSPEFGVSLPNACLAVACENGRSAVRFDWRAA